MNMASGQMCSIITRLELSKMKQTKEKTLAIPAQRQASHKHGVKKTSQVKKNTCAAFCDKSC